jgi:hypothetical protein
MRTDPSIAPTLGAITLVGWLMVQAGLAKRMLDWRGPGSAILSSRRRSFDDEGPPPSDGYAMGTTSVVRETNAKRGSVALVDSWRSLTAVRARRGRGGSRIGSARLDLACRVSRGCLPGGVRRS